MGVVGVVLLMTGVTLVRAECSDYAVSECTGDLNAVYLQLNTDRDKCQQYCALEEDCKFYRYTDQPFQGVNCLLYKEPFNTYISHCNLRSGPKDPTPNCLTPNEDTCDVVNSGKCIYFGTTAETFSVSREDCIALCSINPDCKLWTHQQEQQHCELLKSPEGSCNEVYGPRSKSPTECGEDVVTTTTDPYQPTPPNPLDCPADSELKFYPDEENCGAYWECYKGRITHMECTNCFRFELTSEHAWCSPPEFVDCGSRPHDDNCQVTTAPGPCPYPDGYFKDSGSCDRYYVCDVSHPVSTQCRSQVDSNGQEYQLLYNYDAVQCDWPYRVSCEDRPICDANYENCQCQDARPADPSNPCAGVTGTEIMGFPFDCSQYIICQDEVLLEKLTCTPGQDPGQYYDESNKQCSDSQAVCKERPVCSQERGVADCHCYTPPY